MIVICTGQETYRTDSMTLNDAVEALRDEDGVLRFGIKDFDDESGWFLRNIAVPVRQVMAVKEAR